MKTCDNCGNRAPDEAVYCPACKTRFPLSASAKKSSSGTVAIIIIAVAIVAVMFVAIVGIIAAIAIPNLLTAVQRAKQKRAMGEIRTIATAVQSYAVDNNYFPVVEGSMRPGWNMVPATDLKKILEPDYIRAIPDPDPWENQYYYCFTPDGKDFLVISEGKDKQLDTEGLPNMDSQVARTNCFENDIIWMDDTFLKKPEGKQRGCGSR